MDIGVITQVNTKGQIVIPKKYREKAGISTGAHLKIQYTENGILITNLNIQNDTESLRKEHFLKTLERTAGAWGPETEEEKQDRKKRLRLEKKRLKDLQW
jgi:AbrB family looped-hinge helix DNA binding protein